MLTFPMRQFQLWNYTVGHRTLLMMSVKDDRNDTRLAILYVDVKRLSCPTIFECSGIRTDTHDSGKFKYVFLGADGDDFVVAGNMAHEEDSLEYYAPNLLTRAIP
jgi:hypothetical protein